MTYLTPLATIARRILVLRSRRVLLGHHLAALYGVETKVLMQSVKRNLARFPEDFMFQLTRDEANLLARHEASNLRSQFVTSSYGGRRYLPYAFTEEGVAMLSSVLRSKRAIEVNIEIMRTFVRLRQILAGNRSLAKRLDELERKYDSQFKIVFEALDQLREQPRPPPRRQIGFSSNFKDRHQNSG